jgi:NAD(P)-dependent dehydrogenase (short-subunit alcohol dehydrogenase family)
MPGSAPKTIVISGGTAGMGRATALARLRRGDTVIVIGSNEAKGRALLAEMETEMATALEGGTGTEWQAGAERARGTGTEIGAAAATATAVGGRLRFVRADLSSIAEVDRVVADIGHHAQVVDALILCANRQSPRRRETVDGLEYTFALYYLSRYLLGHRLRPLLDASAAPVIVSVAGVGSTAGAIHWDDLQLQRRYSTIRAQLQAGRANDLLGVAFAARSVGRARYVMYHPGFTRSGDLSTLNPVLRGTIRLLARFAARPVETSVRPIVDFIDRPPSAALTAVDRGKPVDLSLKTLDRGDGDRLAAVTAELLSRHTP